MCPVYSKTVHRKLFVSSLNNIASVCHCANVVVFKASFKPWRLFGEYDTVWVVHMCDVIGSCNSAMCVDQRLELAVTITVSRTFVQLCGSCCFLSVNDMCLWTTLVKFCESAPAPALEKHDAMMTSGGLEHT